jgi:hypothetical protein
VTEVGRKGFDILIEIAGVICGRWRALDGSWAIQDCIYLRKG